MGQRTGVKLRGGGKSPQYHFTLLRCPSTCAFHVQASCLRYGMLIRHVINEESPLFGACARNQLLAEDANFQVRPRLASLTGALEAFKTRVESLVLEARRLVIGRYSISRSVDLLDGRLCTQFGCLQRSSCFSPRFESRGASVLSEPLLRN
jgi:hypothetical protein